MRVHLDACAIEALERPSIKNSCFHLEVLDTGEGVIIHVYDAVGSTLKTVTLANAEHPTEAEARASARDGLQRQKQLQNGDAFAQVWTLEDVLSLEEGRENPLSKEEAREVLAALAETFDARVGINRDVVQDAIWRCKRQREDKRA